MYNAFDAYEKAVNDMMEKIDIYNDRKASLESDIKNLQIDLREATAVRDDWQANKDAMKQSLADEITNLIAEKASVIDQKQQEYTNKQQEYAQQLSDAYSVYQAALASGDQDRIADTLASYNLLVQQSNQEMSVRNQDIDQTALNYDTDIANKQNDYNDFDQSWQNKLDQYNDDIANIDSNIASKSAELDGLAGEVSDASSLVDQRLDEFKQKVNDAIDNCYPYYKDDYTSAAKDLTDLFAFGQYSLNNVLGEDLNPAEAIYEIIKNELWGCDYPDDRIDISSLMKMGAILESEGLGVSCLINNVATAGSYIQKILAHVNGICYDDPVSGKLTFKLIRGDYNINDLVRFTPSNCTNLEFTRLDWSQTRDRVSAKFTYADDKYGDATLTVFDIANNRITHNTSEQQIDASYFTTPENAQVYAKTTLLSAAYPLAAINFECNRIGYNLTLGDPILVSWEPYGIDKQVFRVTDIDYASNLDGTIKITAIEDVFSFDTAAYTDSSAIHWTDPIVEPDSIAVYRIFELPYEFMFNLDTYLRSYVARPSMDVIYYNLWRYQKGTYRVTAKTQNFSVVCKLLYTIPRDYDELSDVELYVYGYNGQEMLDLKIQRAEENPYSYTNRTQANTIWIDDEILSYQSISKAPNGNYILHGVRRGLIDTIPHKHLQNSYVYFLADYLSVSDKPVCSAGSTTTEYLEFTTETLTKAQSFDDDKVFTYATTRRSERPSIMHNMYYGGDRGEHTIWKHYYDSLALLAGDLVFKFNTRNKFINSDLLGQDDDTNVDVADTTQYYIKLSANGVEKEFKVDAVQNSISITSFSIPWYDFCSSQENKLRRVNDVTFRLGTYNKENRLYSHDEYVEEFRYGIPQIIGILDNENDVQDYYDNTAYQQRFIVEETDINTPIAVDVSMGAIILVGDVTILDEATNVVMIGNGDIKYNNITKAFIATSIDNADKTTYQEIELQPGFVVRNNFSHQQYAAPEYFRYLGNGEWEHFIPANM